MPASDIAATHARMRAFFRKNELLQLQIHRLGIWYATLPNERVERFGNFERHCRELESAEHHGHRKSSFTGLLVLAVHVLRCLSHRCDSGVEIHTLSRLDLIARDRICRPALDCAES